MLTFSAFPFLHLVWRIWDAVVPKRDDYWAFPTHHINTTSFIENSRALFESLKERTDLKKIIFYRGESPSFEITDASNYTIVKYGTLKSFLLLARCGVVIVSHSVAMDFSLRWDQKRFSTIKLNLKKRMIVNLWHGIAIKRLLAAANPATRIHTDRNKYRQKERRFYSGLIASSDFDSYAMAAMFYPLSYSQIWITGLPRNDFLLMDESKLPAYIRESTTKLKEIKAGRKLVLYAPTYRQTSVSASARYYQFNSDEVLALKQLLRQHDAILGYRPHYFKNSSTYFNLSDFIDGTLIFDMSVQVVPELSALARECDVLVTDYSSVYLETLYLDKPAISFAYDLDDYKKEQDGLLYDLETVFAGPVCRTFPEVLKELAVSLSKNGGRNTERAEFVKKIFFKFRDVNNSQRVVDRISERMHARKNGKLLAADRTGRSA